MHLVDMKVSFLKKLSEKYSILGLFLLLIHLLLNLWILFSIKPNYGWSGLLPSPISDQTAYFMLFNLPGWYFGSPIIQFLYMLETNRDGNIPLYYYVVTYLLSAVCYYFIGYIVQNFFTKLIGLFKRQ
jgi:hypothetical protein